MTGEIDSLIVVLIAATMLSTVSSILGGSELSLPGRTR